MLDGLAQPLLEAHVDTVAKLVLGAGDVGHRVLDVAASRGLVAHLGRPADDLADRGELVERDAVAAGDVVDAARRRRALACASDVRLDDVVDVGEVARLLAVAEDRPAARRQRRR